MLNKKISVNYGGYEFDGVAIGTFCGYPSRIRRISDNIIILVISYYLFGNHVTNEKELCKKDKEGKPTDKLDKRKVKLLTTGYDLKIEGELIKRGCLPKF